MIFPCGDGRRAKGVADRATREGREPVSRALSYLPPCPPREPRCIHASLGQSFLDSAKRLACAESKVIKLGMIKALLVLQTKKLASSRRGWVHKIAQIADHRYSPRRVSTPFAKCRPRRGQHCGWHSGYIPRHEPPPYYRGMRTQKHPSDLTDEQWSILRPPLPKPRKNKAGRP
jgi:hypothetical protein